MTELVIKSDKSIRFVKSFLNARRLQRGFSYERVRSIMSYTSLTSIIPFFEINDNMLGMNKLINCMHHLGCNIVLRDTITDTKHYISSIDSFVKLLETDIKEHFLGIYLELATHIATNKKYEGGFDREVANHYLQIINNCRYHKVLTWESFTVLCEELKYEIIFTKKKGGQYPDLPVKTAYRFK